VAWELLVKRVAMKAIQRVRFRIRDVYFPNPQELLMELCGADSLRGRIVELSDSGTNKDAYAVIEIDGLSRLVVVPLACVVSDA
jgi:hypothetical protein